MAKAETGRPEAPSTLNEVAPHARVLDRLASVRSNLHGGIERAFQAPITVLWGPGGSLKTAHLRALQFGCLGYVEDFQGREFAKLGGDILEFVGLDEPCAFSEVTFASGKGVRHEARRTRGGGGTPKGSGFDGGFKVAFPLFDVLGELRGSVEKAQDFLLKQTDGGVTREQVEAAISPEYRDLYTSMVDRRLSPAANLRAITSTLAERTKTLKAAAEGKGGSIRLVATGTDWAAKIEAAERVRADRRKGLGEAQQALGAARQAEARRQKRGPWIEGRNRALARVEEIRGKMPKALDTLRGLRCEAEAEAEAEAKAAQDDSRERVLWGGRLLEWLDRLDAIEADVCAMCGGKFDRAARGQRRRDVTRVVGRASAVVHASSEIVSKADALAKKIEAAEAEAKREQTRADDLGRLLAEADDEVGESVEGWRARVASAEADLADADTALARLREARREAEQASAEAETRNKARADYRLASRLLEDCRAAVASVVDEATSRFVRRVQDHLPEEYPFGLRLDGKARFGLVQPNGQLLTGLWGQAWVSVMLALSAACTPADADAAILTTPDRGWWPEQLGETVRALARSGYGGSVVITATVKPAGRMPDEVEVVRLERNS